MKKQVVSYIDLRGSNIVVNADSTMDISLSSITRLDVSQGRKSKAGMGALIGGVVGGIFIVTVISSVCTGSHGCTRDSNFLYGGMYTLAGAGVGALIGLAFKAERWKKVPLSQLQISVVPESENGIGLGVVINF